MGGQKAITAGTVNIATLGSFGLTASGQLAITVKDSSVEVVGNAGTPPVSNAKHIQVAIGNILLETLSGECHFTNQLGHMGIDPTGKATLESLLGSVEVDATGLVSIKSASTDLKTILDGIFTQLDALCTALQALTVGTGVGPSSPPINTAQFLAAQQQLLLLKTQFATLMK